MSQVALSQLGWRNKVVITPDDPGFPGKNMYDAAADLNRRYKKILWCWRRNNRKNNARSIQKKTY